MRTKALLGLAALTVGLTSAVAQNVYSLNVVGYVNVTLQANKLHFLSVPLIPSGGNFNITNSIVLSDSQDQAGIFAWTGTGWNPNAPSWIAGFGWFPDMVISNGVGFFLASKANSTLTFVGDVPQGALAYTIPAGVSTLANKVPVAANFPGSTVGNDQDTMFTWVQTSQAWNPNSPSYIAGYGWFSSDSTVTTNGPTLAPAEAAFYVNHGAALPFTQNFTVQ
jgi:hypothetical protein